MKAMLFGMLFLVLVGAGGFIWLSKNSSGTAQPSAYSSESISRSGVLQKSTVEGVDYRHTIMENGTPYGVMSQKENLDEYVGKNVTATGQNSGTTLYIDSIVVNQK